MPYTKEHLDFLRTKCEFGDQSDNTLVVTPGVADIVGDDITGLMFEFMSFDDWDEGWDADDLHEIGVIDYDGTDIMFKITPLDPKADTYSLTFLLPSEW